MPATFRQHLDPDAVAARAGVFPQLAALSDTRVERVLDGHPVAASKASALLQMLEGSGEQTLRLLERLDEAVRRWDRIDPPGWDEMRRSLPAADRRKLLSMCAELVVAGAMAEAGIRVSEMEPRTGRRRADLRLRLGPETLIVEVTSPGPARADWTDGANAGLRASLERVRSGLHVDVDGYDALDFSLDAPTWGAPLRRVDAGEIDAVVREFARSCTTVNAGDWPSVIVAARPSQPITITAIGPARPGHTAVEISWSRSGLVPDVERLVEIIRGERRQLEPNQPGCLLVDLTNWRDFDRGYYLTEVANQLAGHMLPELVATFFWDVETFLPTAVQVLHCEADWRNSTLAQRVLRALRACPYS